MRSGLWCDIPIEDRRSLGSLQTMMIRTATTGRKFRFETVAEIVPGKSMPTDPAGWTANGLSRSGLTETPTSWILNRIEVEILEALFYRNLSRHQVCGYGIRCARAVPLKPAKTPSEMIMLEFTWSLGIIYALLAIPFRSYFQPLIVMSAIPFGVVGAIMGHFDHGLGISTGMPEIRGTVPIIDFRHDGPVGCGE